MSSFLIRPVTPNDQGLVTRLLTHHWGSNILVSRGQVHRGEELPGFLAIYQEQLAGMITYRIEGRECEITSLNSLVEGIGIGSALIEAVQNTARKGGCRRLWLITTNDNLHALGFYQRSGFKLTKIHRNAMQTTREVKPGIPDTGMNDIPLRDEIELEFDL
jgi:ribosomal protein S18 acetylase RimI-like enzyme